MPTFPAAALYGAVGEAKASHSIQGFRFEPEYPAYKRLVKQTTCDAQGNFAFERVAYGTFYVTAVVSWKAGTSPQGAAYHRVVLTGG